MSDGAGARCPNDRPLRVGESTAAMARRVLERAESGGSGALVLRRADGSVVGAVLAEGGRVCWAVCNDCSRRLSDILVEQAPGLTASMLSELVAECRRDHVPLGETLLARGLISQDVLRRAILLHTCLSLDHLMRADASSWSWTPHSKQSYAPMLTFSAVEVLVGLSHASDPAASEQALAVLRAASGPGLSALTLRRVPGGRVPIAHIDGDGLELVRLLALAQQADEMLAIASIAELQVAALELEDLAFVVWGQGDLRHVLLCHGKLAFNRLLSHVAATAIIGE